MILLTQISFLKLPNTDSTKRDRQSFSDREKKAYIKAELCLMWQKPSRTDHPTAVSLFDDLQGAHQMQALRVHFTVRLLGIPSYMNFYTH